MVGHKVSCTRSYSHLSTWHSDSAAYGSVAEGTDDMSYNSTSQPTLREAVLSAAEQTDF